MKRALKIILGLVLAVVVIVAGGVFVLLRTDYGRERTRRLVLGLLRDKVRGQVKIGRIEGDLLGRFSLVDVAIADSAGEPFLSSKRVTARLATRSLLSKKVILTELALVDPVITLSRRPNEPWNFARVFPSDTTTKTDTTSGFGSWIRLDDVQLTGGALVVLQPWLPDSTLSPAARDSVVAATLAGDARARVEKVSWGYRQTMDFRGIDAQFPHVVVADPDSAAIALQIARLRMVAAPFRPPEIRINDFKGDVRIGDDTVTVRNLALQLPASHATGSITYLMTPGDILLALKGDRLAFADLRGLYPPLPDSGGGSLDLEAAVRVNEPSDYVVRDAKLRISGARVEGDLGLVLSDSITRFHDTDLRFVNFPTSLVEKLVPGVTVPTPGTLQGRAQLSGPMEGMQVIVDATFDPARDAPFRVTARGGVGYDEAVRADRLNVRVERLPVSFLKRLAADTTPIGGMITADATVSGTSTGRLTGRFALTHSEKGNVSRVSGKGFIAPGDRMRMDVGLRFSPFSMELVQPFVPETDVQGVITGTAHLRGTPRDIAARADLTLPAGAVQADGTFRLAGKSPIYSANVTMQDVDVRAVVPSLPSTTLNGFTSVSGEGTDPATLTARASAKLKDFVVDSTRFVDAVVEANAQGGQLTLDTVVVRTAFGAAAAAGTLGLAEGHDGKITYRLDVESLQGLQRWIATGDTSLIAARPGVRQRMAELAARRDTIPPPEPTNAKELAEAIAAEGELGTRRKRRAAPPDVPAIPADSIGGSFHVTGDVQGQIKRLTARGTALTDGIVWGGSEVGRGKVDFVYADAGTPEATLTAEAGVDSIRAAGFAFDSTHLKASYKNGEGDFEVSIFPGDTALYQVKASYALRTGEGEVRLQNLRLQLDSTTWVSARPSAINWRGHGIDVDSLELRERQGGGRIFVDGEIPDVDPGTLVVAVDSLRIAPWLTLLQSDLVADARTTVRARIEGTRLAPKISGTLALASPTYNGVPFPELNTSFNYADRVFQVDGDLRRDTGGELARIHGVLPIDLSLGDSVETRLIDAPIVLDVVGDSIPLAPLQQLSESITSLDGRAYGAIGVRGTYEKPKIEGQLGVDLTRVGLAATGVTYTNSTTHIRMSGDTLVIDSLVAHSGGTIRGDGNVVLATLTHPVLNLRVNANDARVLDNEMGELFASSQLTIKGPLDTLAIGGAATITRGVVFIPDPEKQKLISTGDPAVLAVVDSATAEELDVAPEQQSETVKNMSVDVTLTVARGVFARSSDANIEVYGDLDVELHPATQELTLDGALFTDQGDYTFLGKRFVVSTGSVRFTGGPTLNPILQVLATYEVRQPGRAPLDIRVIVGGTLEKPQISLESSAQPTLSQSDLISFLAFGSSSSSLLNFQGSGVEGGGAGGSSLVGNAGKLATRQLAGVAMGAMVDKAKRSLVEATRADVVNITPADLPADLSLGGLGTLLRGTEVQIGKYIDRRTFLMARVRPTFTPPGLTLEHRLGSAIRLRASYETRFQPLAPSLTTGLEPTTIKVIGALITWRLSW